MSRSEGRRGFDFNTVARSYDAWYERPAGTMYDRLEKEEVSRVLPSPRAGEQLLDVGCGTGHWSTFFTEKGFRVTGVDIAPEMIRVAREKRIPGARFFVADALRLPFPGASFDLLTAMALLEFVDDPGGVLGEMLRCLRPEGSIIVGVLNRWSFQGIRRKWNPSPLFRAARFYSRGELLKLLSRFGPSRVRAAAFVPPGKRLLGTAPFLDRIGKGARLPWGDFLVGKLRSD
jgi:ubiquinone/menaquinone biosynthesis C-methylase UbiE